MTAKLDRMRMIPLIGAILALGFLITNMVSYYIAVDTMRQSIVETELPLTGSNIYSEIQTDLVRPIQVSSLMANDTFVQDWLHSGEVDLAAITRYLQRIQGQYNAFTAFLVSRDTQAYYHFQAPPRHLKRDDPADSWFFRSIDATAPYEVNVDINKQQNDALTVFINYRVLDHNGKMIGLTGIGLDFRTVRNIVSRYRDQFNRNIYFVNAQGDIVVATDADTPVGASIRKLAGLAGVSDRILAEEKGEYSFKRGGRTILLSHRLIPDLGWRVMVEQDEAAAMRPLWLGFLFNLAIGFLVIAVSLVLVSAAFGVYKKRVGELAFRDPLTGLANRAGFEAEFDARLSARRVPTEASSLILVDLDAFAAFNDRFGRAAGNAALDKVGRILSEVASGVGVIARFDGDNFAILRKGSSDAATRFADSLVKVIGAETFGDSALARLTASIGVTAVGEGEDHSVTMERVDRALRKAKAAGGDRVCLA
ncbi:diguanylate cyclase domain-containing protein [Pleomorphomonas sp. PLEO]|uniref:GGDEF domain-containing protein n=1 Tax=Pleomorphomonas sp. PLEO TaxID=3239306 RepID=UPI00351DD27C